MASFKGISSATNRTEKEFDLSAEIAEAVAGFGNDATAAQAASIIRGGVSSSRDTLAKISNDIDELRDDAEDLNASTITSILGDVASDANTLEKLDSKKAEVSSLNSLSDQVSSIQTYKTLDGSRGLFIGDSLTEHQCSGGSSFIYNSNRSWLTWLETLSGGTVRCRNWIDNTIYPGWYRNTPSTRGFFGQNCGVYGQTSTEILARIPQIISNFKFEWCILEMSANDPSDGISVSTSLNNLKSAINLLVSAGIEVFVFSSRIRSSTGTNSFAPGSTSRKFIYNWNWQAREIVWASDRAHWIDWNEAWTNGLTSSGDAKTDYGSDAIHDAPIGGFYVGQYLWQGNGIDWHGFKQFIKPTMAPKQSAADDVFDSALNPFANVHPNSKMLGTGGTAQTGIGATGTVADLLQVRRSSATGSTTVACTVGNNSLGTSKKQILTFTPGGTASELFFLSTLSTISVSALANQWVEASVDVKVSGAYSKLEAIELCFIDAAAGVTVKGAGTLSGYFLPNTTWEGRIFSPVYKMPASPTTLSRLAIQVTLTGGGTGTPIIEISNFLFHAIPNPQTSLGYIQI